MSVRANHEQILQRCRAALGGDAPSSDGELLADYLNGDVPALEALVLRHGPMVWAVCRRVLHNHADAEDAFQTTFLVLVRRSASLDPTQNVAGWLHAVAQQTALKARATVAKRQLREVNGQEFAEPCRSECSPRNELAAHLDEELGRLPENYRNVIVLCDLEGRTRREIAGQLGVPEGTVAGWLSRGRDMLARRLARQGLTVSIGPVLMLLAQDRATAVPASIISNTINAAVAHAAEQAAAGAFAHLGAALLQGGQNVMLHGKLKAALVAAIVVVGCIGLGRMTDRVVTAPATAAEKKPPQTHGRDFPYWSAPKRPHTRAFVPGLQAALQLTPEQIEKIEAVCNDTIDRPENRTKETAGAAFEKARAQVADILTADQKKLIEKINDAYAKVVGEVSSEYTPRFGTVKGNDEERAKISKEMHEAIATAFEKKLDTLLSAEQRAAVKKLGEEQKRRDEEAKKNSKK